MFESCRAHHLTSKTWLWLYANNRGSSQKTLAAQSQIRDWRLFLSVHKQAREQAEAPIREITAHRAQ
jgi:hypothetical protein